eukprot:scaffold70400_cov19-Tisochrysis_lutea.AAC.1
MAEEIFPLMGLAFMSDGDVNACEELRWSSAWAWQYPRLCMLTTHDREWQLASDQKGPTSWPRFFCDFVNPLGCFRAQQCKAQAVIVICKR